MRRWIHWIFLGMLLAAAAAHADPALTLVRTIRLPNVAGRIDHLALDDVQGRLFVAALGNHSVEVIDLQAGQVARHLADFNEPQGIAYLPGLRRLVVADGGANRVDILDGQSFRVLHQTDGLDDADNVRVDTATGQVYVGFGSGGLHVLNGNDGTALRTLPLTAHPEAFEIDPVGNKLFVNTPEKQQIAVIDRRHARVATIWKLEGAAQNFPMALDSTGRRLFVGTRRPARLQVYDADHGKLVAQLPIGADPDDIFFDKSEKRLYVVCGGGVVNVIRQVDLDHYTLEATVPTRRGARTGLLAPERRRLYVAVPQSEAHEAEIRVFAISQ